mmetsp:Transcript_24668/g.56958  ORF Transcript_24668/g.56958 Transcript_24668/m.56958 type:complete len:750 (-) Transcript_24668:52-2301(-)
MRPAYTKVETALPVQLNAPLSRGTRWADLSPTASATPCSFTGWGTGTGSATLGGTDSANLGDSIGTRSYTIGTPVAMSRRVSQASEGTQSAGLAPPQSPLAAPLAKGTRWADLTPQPTPTAITASFSMIPSSSLRITRQISGASAKEGMQVRITAAAPQVQAAGVTSRQRPGELNAFNITPTPTSTPTQGLSISAEIEEVVEHMEEEEDDEEVGQGTASAVLWSGYLTTPHRCVSELDKEAVLTAGLHPRIGIDIGGVLTRDGDPNWDRKVAWDIASEAPGGLDAVRKIAIAFGPNNTFLVSKVRPGGNMQQKIEHWLHETCLFCEKTQVPKKNIIFCSEPSGPQGKGPVAMKLGLSHFVDDKMEVLESVFHDEAGNAGHIVERFDGLLFHFAKGGIHRPPPEIDLDTVNPRMRKHYQPVANWKDVVQHLSQHVSSRLYKFMEDDQKDAAIKALQEPPARAAPDSAYEPQPMRTPGGWRRPLPLAQPATAVAAGQVQPAGTAPATVQMVGGRPRLQLKPRDPQLGTSTGSTCVAPQQRQPPQQQMIMQPQPMLQPQQLIQQQVLQPHQQMQPQLQQQQQPPSLALGGAWTTSFGTQQKQVPMAAPVGFPAPPPQTAAPCLTTFPNGISQKSHAPVAAPPAMAPSLPQAPLPPPPSTAPVEHPRLVSISAALSPRHSQMQPASPPTAGIVSTSPAWAPSQHPAPGQSFQDASARGAPQATEMATGTTPALQKDPQGGRPRLFLKPRTVDR